MGEAGGAGNAPAQVKCRCIDNFAPNRHVVRGKPAAPALALEISIEALGELRVLALAQSARARSRSGSRCRPQPPRDPAQTLGRQNLEMQLKQEKPRLSEACDRQGLREEPKSDTELLSDVHSGRKAVGRN
jgi:hypothetical protein